MSADREQLEDGQLHFWHAKTPDAPRVSPARPAVLSTGEARTSESLEAALKKYSGRPVRVIITDNRTRMITSTPMPWGNGLTVRLHRMFLDADEQTLQALAQWLTRPRGHKPGQRVDAFIRKNRDRIKPREPREPPITHVGLHHDLDALYHDLNQLHFDGRIDARITWSSHGPRGRRKSIRFGSYSYEQRLIRIHPRLDQPWVPAFFVRSVIYHEMLHAALGCKTSATGRRMMHTAEFRRQEQAFPEYERARAWQDKNLKRLLR